MFVDKAEIFIKAGRGGDGAVAFHREKYVAAGGPDGGDGGRGGDVVFEADGNMSTLLDFRYKRKYKAGDGQNGQGSNCFGKAGKNLVIRVPAGTVIKNADTGRILKDMSDGRPFVAAEGGRGGWGNAHFATATRQAPRFAKSGLEGEEKNLLLELKLLADVGLLGFPNVGKSTFLSIVSAARPKIANYHFTTLTPKLGVVAAGDGGSFVMADIPGLIEGAAEGVGLGHDFLRHVERCRLLLHIVDISGSEGRNPIDDFNKINAELEKYSPELARRPQIVVGNKTDIIADAAIADGFREFIKKDGAPYFEMSAATGAGVREALDAVREAVSKLPPPPVFEAEPDFEQSREDRGVQIELKNGVYEVTGKWLLSVLGSVNFDDYESLQYMQRVLTSNGVYQALEQAGVKEGDTVSIYGVQFDYVK